MTTIHHSVDPRTHFGAMDDTTIRTPRFPSGPARRGAIRRSTRQILAQYDTLNKADKGALLRREVKGAKIRSGP
jgi:hypothetical protein